MYLIDIRYVIK